MRIFTTVVACVLLAMPLLPGASQCTTLSTDFPIGSKWSYNYTEWLNASVSLGGDGAAMKLVFWGTCEIECIGLSDLPGGAGPQALEYRTTIRAVVTGTVAISSWWGPPIAGTPTAAQGSLKSTSEDFYNTNTGFVARSVQDQELDVHITTAPRQTRSIMYFSEHNETVYDTVEMVSHGRYIDPSLANLTYGDSWMMKYQGRSNASGVLQTHTTSYVGGIKATQNFTYVGEQSISVAAGVFNCSKLNVSGEGYNSTEWYDPTVGQDVKTITRAVGDTVTYSLESYTLARQTEGVDGRPAFNQLYFAASVIIVFLAVLMIPLVHLAMKTRSPRSKGP